MDENRTRSGKLPPQSSRCRIACLCPASSWIPSPRRGEVASWAHRILGESNKVFVGSGAWCAAC